MPDKRKHKRKWVNRLQRHYRLVVMNDENFEVKASIKLNPVNLLLTISTLFVIYAIIIIALMRIAPVNEIFFGPDKTPEMKQELLRYHVSIDSLNNVIADQSRYLGIITQVLRGEVDTTRPTLSETEGHLDSLHFGPIGHQDSMLRAEYERRRNYGILVSSEKRSLSTIEELYFIPPVRGIVTKSFEQEYNHFGIDIVADENAAIKATLEGKVIFTGWTSEYGNVIAIQHGDNLVSVYKHNAVLLKKVGTFVSAGEVVALLGNTGELSQGPHLHFELWHDMVPINPLQYIVFN